MTQEPKPDRQITSRGVFKERLLIFLFGEKIPRQSMQSGKRIVSKSAYVKACLRQIGLGSAGFLTIVVFGTSIVIVPLLALAFIASHWNVWIAAAIVLFCVAYGVLAWRIGKKGEDLVNLAKQIDTGVPATRANAADLPASDSLVRASQEPAQSQEGVLLRAASGETQMGEEKQLLRASAEGQKPA